MSRKQEAEILALRVEVARLNAQIISSILPALKDSTLAVANALDLVTHMKVWFEEEERGREGRESDREARYMEREVRYTEREDK